MRELGLNKAQMGRGPNEGTRAELVQLELKEGMTNAVNYSLK